MKNYTIKHCLDAEIEYQFYDYDDMEMNQSDYDHVQNSLKDGFSEGELCSSISGIEEEIYGYWKLLVK